jgi:hypothetical protein
MITPLSRNWWLLGIGGALSILSGIWLILFPGTEGLSITWFIGSYMILLGVVLVALGFRSYRQLINTEDYLKPIDTKDYLKPIDTKELEDSIGKLCLEETQIALLKRRWLRQVRHWDQYAHRTHRKYVWLRGIMVLVGVLIPVLASLQTGGPIDLIVRPAIILLSLVVALCAAWEGLQNYGDTWRLKRRAADLLLAEGWRFFQKSGEYSTGHKTSYPLFVARTEEIIERAIDDYMALTRREKDADGIPRSDSSEGQSATRLDQFGRPPSDVAPVTRSPQGQGATDF